MNENQKKVLQLHHQELVRDLELRPDLIGSFIHLGLFNEDMIEEIQVMIDNLVIYYNDEKFKLC